MKKLTKALQALSIIAAVGACGSTVGALLAFAIGLETLPILRLASGLTALSVLFGAAAAFVFIVLRRGESSLPPTHTGSTVFRQ